MCEVSYTLFSIVKLTLTMLLRKQRANQNLTGNHGNIIWNFRWENNSDASIHYCEVIVVFRVWWFRVWVLECFILCNTRIPVSSRPVHKRGRESLYRSCKLEFLSRYVLWKSGDTSKRLTSWPTACSYRKSCKVVVQNGQVRVSRRQRPFQWSLTLLH